MRGAAAVRGCTVAVDARGLRLSGIGRYLREVLRVVLADARFGRVILAGRMAELEEFVGEHDGRRVARLVSFPHHFYSAAAQLRWAALQARGELRADVAFFPHYDVPLTHGVVPSVVTVQDLAHFRLAPQFPRWKRTLASVVLARAVRRAVRVVVTSRATRGDLMECHPEVAAKLDVIPLGVSPFSPTGVVPPARAAQIDEWRPFLLCVGNRKLHKNLVAAVEALHRVRRQVAGTRLVIAGEDFGEDAAVRDRVHALGLDEAVVWFGRATETELAHLYARAGCLLFPSIFEGFGLPPLEAMVAGLPVVASDRASIPEVVGGAAAVVDPHDWDAMAGAAARLLTDPAHRAEMVARGRARAAAFRWDATGARVADVLREAARGPAVRTPTPHGATRSRRNGALPAVKGPAGK